MKHTEVGANINESNLEEMGINRFICFSICLP
jgi:hypothetical protein